ncbi:asparagine synthase (glutamine-hydrolyzing) [Candidatus Woesearchaeota archaeon]|nr:asparagine synthase (glutamine-hydrolyzing) [Candidatus Woesearchaeota archaeon]
MCGICGFNWDDKNLIQRMNSKLEHRGPDDKGHIVTKGMSLGHRRLSIIDLSTAGRQPMSNEEGSIWIVFNGEIYNYKKIRQNLENKHKFKSNTDTEVIIHAYEEYGDNCVELFNGAFAFAIWDNRKNHLFMARDRHGIKPFYYYWDGERFIFASEIKAILEADVKKEINLDAVYSFLTFRCNSERETMFKNIYKLLPGHQMTYNGRLFQKKYWQFPKFEKSTGSVTHFAKLLDSLITDSVKKRLMSDVPLGAYLSGGIDSASIVSMMRKFGGEVNTFSIGFDNAPQFNELDKARFIAEYFSTDHNEIIVKVDAIKLLPRIVWHLDEPMADPTAIPVYALSNGTKKHATVVLTGDGGDEQFGGYEQFKIMMLYKRYLQKVPLVFRKNLAKLVQKVPPSVFSRFFKYADALGEKGIERLSNVVGTNDVGESYLNMVSIFDEKEKSEVINNYTGPLNYSAIFSRYFSNVDDYLYSIIARDTEYMLSEDILMKTDKNTMAHAIEARVPFLDHRITELMARVPSSYKINGTNEKFILKTAMKGKLPGSTLKNKKQRFFVPIDNWFSRELNDFILQKLDQDIIKRKGIFNYNYIEKVLKDFKKSRLYYSRQLWCLLTFELWHDIFINDEKLSAI